MYMEWKKVPSVTTGGKPYFWYLDLSGFPSDVLAAVGLDYKASVAWNRRAKKWEVNTGGNFEKSLGLFDSDKAGKEFVEARLPKEVLHGTG
jgi:hypothetical protein